MRRQRAFGTRTRIQTFNLCNFFLAIKALGILRAFAGFTVKHHAADISASFKTILILRGFPKILVLRII